VTISGNIIRKETPPTLCNRRTNWALFQIYINEKNCLNIRLKGKQELEEAVEYMTKLMQEAATISTPAIKHQVPESHNIPLHVKELAHEKRRARRRWQNSRNLQDKTYINRLTHNLQTAITVTKNEAFYHITELSTYDQSIWKATKEFKRVIVPIPPLRKPDRSWAHSPSEKQSY
jgi:hypothetical protein